MDKISSFKDLIAWQKGHKVVIEIYIMTRSFPKDELFGLTNQLRRAAVSITSNIAEGFSRRSYKEKLQFYSMSLGSLTEVQNQLLIAKDVNYVNSHEFQTIDENLIEVNKLINGLIKKCKSFIHNT